MNYLRPCPFCGGTAKINNKLTAATKEFTGRRVIQCTCCGALVFSTRYEDVENKWNCRLTGNCVDTIPCKEGYEMRIVRTETQMLLPDGGLSELKELLDDGYKIIRRYALGTNTASEKIEYILEKKTDAVEVQSNESTMLLDSEIVCSEAKPFVVETCRKASHMKRRLLPKEKS